MSTILARLKPMCAFSCTPGTKMPSQAEYKKAEHRKNCFLIQLTRFESRFDTHTHHANLLELEKRENAAP